MQITSMFCSNSCWTYPFIIDLNTALEDHIYHVFSANIMVIDLDTSSLPCFKHLILALPVSPEHDTVMRLLIQIMNIFETKIDALVHPTHLTIVRPMDLLEICMDWCSIWERDVLSMEKINKILFTDVMVMDYYAACFLNLLQVIFADKLMAYHETFCMLESKS